MDLRADAGIQMTIIPTQRDRRPGARGFTLIEVMISLAIFALAAVVLGAAYVNVITAYEVSTRARLDDEDLRFARGLLMAQADPKKVQQGGQFDTVDGRHVTWLGDFEATTIPDLFDVTLTCDFSATAGEKEHKVVEHFRLLRPTWSDPVERDKLRADERKRILDLQQEANSQ